MRIHPTAIIADGAQLGADVSIGPYCTVGPRVRLGDRCKLQSHVVIDGDTWLGDDCDLYPFVTLGVRPQDKKLIAGEVDSKLRIGSNNVFRESVTLHGGTPHGSGTTTVGNHNMFLVGSHVGHDATVGNGIVFTNGSMAAGHVTIEDRSILGAMVGVHQFARVGKLAMVGAGARLSRDAPPFSLVQGDRARLVGINVIGMRRAGLTGDDITDVKRVFRILFWGGGLLPQRLEHAQAELGHVPHAHAVIEFVRHSRRGVCMPRSREHQPADMSAHDS